jgi:hypothetical protein
MLIQKIDTKLLRPPLFTAGASTCAKINAALMERTLTG